MVIDIENQTIQLSSFKGKRVTLPLSVINKIGYSIIDDRFVVIVVDANRASIDGDVININDGANCMSYSAEYIAKSFSKSHLNKG